MMDLLIFIEKWALKIEEYLAIKIKKRFSNNNI